MEDSRLVSAAMRGDAQAFSELVQTHQRALVASAWQLTRNREDAEDLAQDACVEAYRKLRTLKDSSKFRPWLFVILRNKCYRYLQQRHPEEFSLEEHADTLAAPTPYYACTELFALVEQLPLPYREVLIARYVHELSYTEIAEILGGSEQAARVRCLRARERLRTLAQQEQADERLLTQTARALVLGISTTLLSRVTKEIGTTMYAHALSSKAPIAQAPTRWAGWQGLAHVATWQTAATVTAVLAIAGIGLRFALQPHGQPPRGAGVLAAAGAAVPRAKSPDAATIKRLNATSYTIDTTIASANTGPGRFTIFGGIALDAQGNIYKSDADGNRVKKFTADGTLLTQWGTPGSGDGQFSTPTGIAVGTDGTVYVGDAQNFRIEKFTTEGKYLGQWSIKEQADQPVSALMSIGVNAENHVYVIGFGAPTFMQVFTSEGKRIGKWQIGSEGRDNPHGIVFDSMGNVYLVIVNGHRVKKFSPEGKPLGDWQVLNPVSIAIDAADHLYIGQSYKSYGIRKQTTEGETLVENILATPPADDTHAPSALAISADGTLYAVDIEADQQKGEIKKSCIQVIKPAP